MRSETNRNNRSFQITWILLLAIPLLTPRDTCATELGTIIVRVVRLKSNIGFIRFGVFNSKETFPKSDKIMQGGAHPIKDKKCEFAVEGLAPGEYAIAVGHDKNGNGEIDRFFGIPLEPVGVSGYSKRLLSPPNFEKAKILIKGDKVSVEIPVF